MCALRKIRALTDFFSRQKIFKFYASSLLLTYDSADPVPPGPEEEEEVAVCMIDFAHAVPVDGDGELGEGPAEAPGDKGYLYGAKNVSFVSVGVGEDLWCLIYFVLGVFCSSVCAGVVFVYERAPVFCCAGFLSTPEEGLVRLPTCSQFPIAFLILVSPLRACVRADGCSLLASWRSCWK